VNGFSINDLLFTGNSTKQAFKDVAEEHDMVYFGRVDQQTDDHKLVRGVTLSPTHRDDHYCIGAIAGRDAILVERTDTITHPDHSPLSYTWTIACFDLHSAAIPHVVIDAGHHDKIFYDQFFTKFFQFMAADASVFEGHDERFTKQFTVYTPPDAIDLLNILLPADTTAVLGHHFSHFSYEFFDDTLIVYTPKHKATKHLLDQMIHAGTWLASEIEKTSLELGVVET
jgi:hypothetical protein